MSENTMFGDLLEEKNGWKQWLTNPATWIAAVMILVGAGLVVFLMNDVSRSWTPEEVENAITVVDESGRWVDKQVTDYDVTIVPSISFKLKNKGKKPLEHLNLVGVFAFSNTGETLGDGAASIKSFVLKPGMESAEIEIKSTFGYRARTKRSFQRDFDKWQPVKVRLMAHVGEGFAKLGEFDIPQTIVGADQEESSVAVADGADSPRLAPLQVLLQDSKWVDKLVTDEQAVIVPSVTVKLQNVGDKELAGGFVKGIFEFEDDGIILGEGFAKVFETPLAPGAASDGILIKAQYGSYSARKKEDFANQKLDWRKVVVRVFFKTLDSDYALLGTYPVSQKVAGIAVAQGQGS